ncbi:type II toxin-antitoxin system HigB family toxin [Sphaerospermopsis aphanizomenoides BCCUSP55]|uniref:type II toxin-antitoxin system HigB family toxin n=1 Tax=Sphaerospermopsis aphanizomenoides TaxID=459663 RepID=UPI001904DA00|nr:type II toxin-antitoxin system HigB family toxin [Sphaerospermopsis aphanizomenoides]MBK1988419.1 type II toxin-antitoxin system HigB family toxin [Sphaerospermopsis aphanizomenoides BCCUSP55]
MHIISKKRLKEFWEQHPKAEPNLQTWYRIVSKAKWENFVELRQVLPSADLVGNFTVFNISGNNYRLIALVDYQYQEVYIRHILTHAEYDKQNWKQDPWYT